MKEEDMNKADFFTSIFLFLFGLIIFIMSLKMPTFREVGADPYSAPGIVPGILGVIIACMGAILFFRSVIRKGYKIHISFQSIMLFLKNNSIKRFLIALFLSLFYVIFLGKIDYFILTGIYIFSFILAFESKSKKNIILALLLAVAIAASISFVFRYLFLVTLP